MCVYVLKGIDMDDICDHIYIDILPNLQAYIKHIHSLYCICGNHCATIYKQIYIQYKYLFPSGSSVSMLCIYPSLIDMIRKMHYIVHNRSCSENKTNIIRSTLFLLFHTFVSIAYKYIANN